MQFTYKHIPQYFQFYLVDSAVKSIELKDELFDAFDRERLIVTIQGAVIGVKSEFSEMPIEINIVSDFEYDNFDNKYNFFRDFSIETPTCKLVLAGCPDGPIYGKFGEIKLKGSSCDIRIFYGGQDTAEPDGTSHDFYRLDIKAK